MLGLAQEVGGHIGGVGGLVGYHKHLGGPRHHINIHLAIGQPFGGGHESIARPHQLIHLWNEAGPKGQGRNGLGSAHGDDPIHSGNFGGGQHSVVQIFSGRGHHDQFLDPRYLGGDRVHQN